MPSHPITHRILIIAPNWVGDAIMAQSLYRLIKMHHPQCSIDVIGPSAFEALHLLMPEVDSFIASPLKHSQLNFKACWQLAKKLKKNNYQQAFILPNSLKSALIPWLCRIKIRTGFMGEMRYILLNDIRKLNPVALPTMAERFNALSFKKNQLPKKIPIPAPSLQIDRTIALSIAKKLQLNTEKPILILCPGAAFGPAKRWPTEHFKTIAEFWFKEQQGQVWILGDTKDKPLADEISNNHPAIIPLASRTSLHEACHLMALGALVVSNDSGLMHLAAALKKPLIAIYGSSTPAFTPPLGNDVQIFQSTLPCSPCFDRVCRFSHNNCLKETTPRQVIASIPLILRAAQ